jgi:large subunit ribosomal protein L24
MRKLKIKNGDNVEVITGDDKGKSGTVLNIDPFALKIQVSGCRINTKLNKQERTFYKEEGWMDYSNVKLAGAAKKKTTKKKKKKTTKKAAAQA